MTKHSPLPTAVVEGADHIVCHANPAFCRLMNKSLEQIVGKPLAELLPDKDACLALVDRVFHTGNAETHTETEDAQPHRIFWSYTIWPVQAGEQLKGVMIQVTETAEFHAKTLTMNQELVRRSTQQRELAEAAENLNRHLRQELLERMRAEEVLRHRTRQFEALLDTAPVGVYLVDADFKFSAINPAAKEFFGNIPDVIGRDFEEVVCSRCDRSDTDDIVARFRHTLETGEPYFVPKWITEGHDPKTSRCIEWQLNRIPLPDGRYGVVCYFREITERILAEQKIRESEERYRSLFNSIDQGFCTIEVLFDEAGRPVDHRFLEVNPAFERYTGIKDPVGRLMSELVPAHEQHWNDIYGRVITTGTAMRLEERAEALHRWYDVFVSRVGEAANRKVAVLFSDITERKRAQEDLAEKARLLDLSNDAIIVRSLDGIIRSWNKGAEKLFGWRCDEVIGQQLHVLLQTEFHTPKDEIIAKLFRDRDFSGEVVQTTRDGRRVALLCRWVLDVDAKFILTSYTDISSRKAAEEEIARARDQAVAASRAKDDFLAALSHELRTPLSPVLLMADEAANDPAMPVEARQIFSTISKNVTLEARIIDDLLDITRITHGKVTLDFQVVDVQVTLRDAIENVRPELEAKQITVQQRLEAEQPLVLGDPVRLQQIFWNVLRNAVKFSPVGAEINVETCVMPGDILSVKIIDHGIGMTAQELTRIFFAFSQGDHAGAGNAHHFGGLGLGLAISRMLTELHSGRIRAESPGKNLGSTFVIELPLNQAARAKPAPSEMTPPGPASVAPAAKAAHPCRVLLVEDHEPTRLALTHLLVRRHYEVAAVGTLAGAREAANSSTFDILLSDIGLPDGNGHELMADLHARYGLKGIALTGYGMEEDLARSRAAGFVTHLTKPVSMHSLEHALDVVATKAGCT